MDKEDARNRNYSGRVFCGEIQVLPAELLRKNLAA
jgi:hypothetical protein